MPLQLEGRVDDGAMADASELPQLRDDVIRLEEDLRNARQELFKLRNQSAAAANAIASLRDMLAPWRRVILGLWGEIELAGVTGVPTPTATQDSAPVASPKSLAAWTLWKQRLPGFPSRMIDALLEHGELSVAQLVVAAQCPRKQTIYDAASKLQKLGLINSNGGKYSLKSL